MGNFHWRQDGGWCHTCLHVNVVVGKINPQRQRKTKCSGQTLAFLVCCSQLLFPSPYLEKCSSFSTKLLLVRSFRQHSQPRTRCCQVPYLLLSCLSPVYGKPTGLKLPRHGCGKLVTRAVWGGADVEQMVFTFTTQRLSEPQRGPEGGPSTVRFKRSPFEMLTNLFRTDWNCFQKLKRSMCETILKLNGYKNTVIVSYFIV